jgi:N-acetylglucosamine kinase-like BadF-type ATPase
LADDPLLPRPAPRSLRPAVLAIDGGNSKTDVALVANDGTLLAPARGPGINAHEVGVDQTVLILDAVVKQAAAQLDGRHGSRSGWIAQHISTDRPGERERISRR